jgi:hypothetical protein
MKAVNLGIGLAAAFVFSFAVNMQAQEQRASPAASAAQVVGKAQIRINYSSPGVKNRKIWGELVPFGLTKNKDGKMIPWRAGANENTTFSTTKDIKIEGQALKAGTYGLHMIPGQEEFVVIFSKNSTAWGSFSYDESQDALRVKVKSEAAAFQELLSYGFDNLTDHSCTVYLQWEKLRIPFKLELP